MKSPRPRLSSRSLFVSVAALGLVGGMLGCPVTNTEHCAYPMGGGTVCGEGLMCSKCEISNNGCVSPEVVSADCMFEAQTTESDETTGDSDEPTVSPTTPGTDPDTTTPPTATETTTEVPATTTTTGETTDPDTTTTTTNTTGPECDPNEGMVDCMAPEPYCSDAGVCIPCSEPGFDCEAQDPETAACNPDSGMCVECVNNGDCDQAAPFCDLSTNTCNTCTEHEHCPESACNLENGECLPEDNVIYVENSPVKCSDSPGNDGHDPEMPICRLSIGLTRVTPDQAATIKITQGSLAQDQPNAVPLGVTVAIISDGVSLARNGAEPALSVSGGSHVFVHRVAAVSVPKNQTTRLIRCESGSTLWLDRLSVYDGQHGVMASDCVLHIRRSVVFQNSNGGIDLTTVSGMTKLWLENSYVTDNGEIYGIRVAKNSFLDIVYSTIAANTKTMATAQISCTAAPDANMRLRNSLLADNAGSYVTGCEQEFASDADTNLEAMATTLQHLVEQGIADSFSSGVVRAESGGPLMDKAVWKQGDPVDDYDMDDVRPNVEDSPDYAGADVP